MPAGPFRARAQLADEQLAARFRVPAEKIADRRAELTADREGRVPADCAPSFRCPGPRDTSPAARTRAVAAGACRGSVRGWKR